MSKPCSCSPIKWKDWMSHASTRITSSARLDHRKLNSHKSKFVRSNRCNIQYIKSSLLYEEKILGVSVQGLVIAKVFTGKLNLKKPMKRNNEDVQIYLSRHVKARNLGINDIEIIDKECGTIGVKGIKSMLDWPV